MNKKDRQELFLDDYARTGNISQSCRNIQISTGTFYNWMNDEEFPKQFKIAKQQAKEDFKDFLEAKAKERIEAGSDSVLIFSLKTQARDRGWSDRKELEVQTFSRGEVNVNINVPKPPQDILNNWKQNTNIDLTDEFLDD